MGFQLSGRPVTGNAARSQDVVGQRIGEVPGCRGVVDGPITGHVEQRGWSSPARGRDHQVGVKGPSVAQRDLGHAALALHGHNAFALAGVQHGHDFYADPLQIGDCRVPVGVGGHDYGLVPWLHSPEVDEPSGGAGEHDARGVVAGEYVRTFHQAGGHDHYSGPGLDEALGGDVVASLHDGNPVVVVASGHRGVDQHLDVAVGSAGSGEVRTLCPLGVVTP